MPVQDARSRRTAGGRASPAAGAPAVPARGASPHGGVGEDASHAWLRMRACLTHCVGRCVADARRSRAVELCAAPRSGAPRWRNWVRVPGDVSRGSGLGPPPRLSGSSGKSRGLGQERDAGLAAGPMPAPSSPAEGVPVRVPVVGGPRDGLANVVPCLEAPSRESERAQRLPSRLDQVQVGGVFRLEHHFPARMRQHEEQHAGQKAPKTQPLPRRP
jgi:hypothetical protein